MKHKEIIHLSDCTDRGVKYSVTIHEMNIIFSTFQTFIFFTRCQQFQFINDMDLKS